MTAPVTAPGTHSSPYSLGHDEQELRRLQDQSVFFDPLTRQFLRELGIGAGLRVLDIGCGAGDVSMLLTEFVGERGEVHGVDRGVPALQLAKARAQARGLSQVHFHQGDEHTAVALAAERPFDVVIGRLVLVHQHRPGDFVRVLAQAVRPGGVLAFQDSDLTLFMHTMPQLPLLAEVRRWFIAAHERIHATWNLSLQTPAIFRSAGLPPPQQYLYCPVLGDGLHVLCQSVAAVIRSLLPILLQGGIVDAAEVDIDTLADRMLAALKENQSAVQSVAMANCYLRLPG